MKGRKTLKTRKEIIMKKVSLQSLVNYLNGETVTNLDEIKAEIEAELSRGEERRQANASLYDEAKPVIFEELGNASNPITIGELFEAVESKLPEGFGKGKLQYAVTRLWTDEIVKTEGKVNTYSLK